jgi:ribosomal protein S18 acetylase RimI-like enzyme
MHTPSPLASTSAGSLRLLTPDDLPAAAEVFARAFDGDPVASLLLPDDDARGRFACWLGEASVRAALPYASVYGVEVTGELAGLAVWHPPSVVPGSVGDTLALLRGVPGVLTALARMPPRLVLVTGLEPCRLRRLLRAQSRARSEAGVGPAWHLAYLAVAPEHQGNGYARLLLDHVLDRCDEDGTAAWLETTDPANPARYERFGFRTVRQVHPGRRLPGLWVMRREPFGVEPLAPVV